MSDEQNEIEAKSYDYGPLQTFEVIWVSGHVERIQAHQVSYPNNPSIMFGSRFDQKQIIEFHGEIDGHWRLQLRAPADEIHIVRNVSQTEPELT